MSGLSKSGFTWVVQLLVVMLSSVVACTGSAQVRPAVGVTDPEIVLPVAPLAEQPVGVPFLDPAFGTSLRRVTDERDHGGFGTQIYSQLQAFSADNAHILLIESGAYTVRRLSDLGRVELDSSTWNAPRWHPLRADTIVHFDSNDDTVLRVQTTDVSNRTTVTVFTFPAEYQRIRGNQSFDELSRDGRWLGGLASRSDGEQVVFALDLEARALGAELRISELYAGECRPDPEWGAVEPDWIGVSPLGKYLVVQWERDGNDRCSGLETFDLRTGGFVGRVYDGHAHGDLGVDRDGATEFFMTTELSSPEDNNRPALSIRRLPGGETASPPVYLRVMDWADVGHISCRGPAGVCLVSWGSLGSVIDWAFEDEVFLLFTDGSVRRLAHHRSSKCGYWVQPRASISGDGRYAVFASDWAHGSGGDSCGDGSDLGGGDAYVVDLSVGSGP